MNLSKNILLSSICLLSPVVAFAQQAPSAAPGGSGLNMIVMMILMFVIIYFFMIRPEQKKQKARAELLKNVKKGDKVLTAGGIVGIVGNVKDNTVVVRIADNTNVEFTKSAITNVITEEPAKSPEKEGK
jgi:preprotein translocase subunit YajC